MENIELDTQRDADSLNTKREELITSVRENLEETRKRIIREKELDKALDLMVREQAEQVWTEREKLWAKEREASEKLLKQVLAYQQTQVDEKREQFKQRQQQLLVDREELLSQIEHIAAETAEKQLQEKAEKAL